MAALAAPNRSVSGHRFVNFLETTPHGDKDGDGGSDPFDGSDANPLVKTVDIIGPRAINQARCVIVKGEYARVEIGQGSHGLQFLLKDRAVSQG